MSLLKQIDLFAELADDELSVLEKHAVPRSFAKNTIVVSEGDPTDSLYIIVTGRVKVYCSDESGKQVTLNDLKPGDYFGEIALFDDAERSASVMTMEPSRFLIINKAAFKQALASHPEISFSLIRHLTKRVRDLTQNVKSLALMDVYGRIANTLLHLSTADGARLVTEIPLTQQEIANRVGASREMVAKILKDLETGGYITVEKRKIVINQALPARY